MNGSKAIIICGNEILLFHRDNKPECKYPLHWQIIGGGIEEGETPEDALVREVKEEASYEAKNFTFIEKTIGSLGEDVFWFLIKIDDFEKDKFKIGPGEGLDVKFFTIEEALRLNLTPGTKRYMEENGKILEEWMR